MEPDTQTALERLVKSIQTFDSLSMLSESRDKLYRYHDALMQSLYSILEDTATTEEEKLAYFNTSLEQYAEAMRELFPKLINGKQPDTPMVVKSEPDRFDAIEEV